MDWGSIGKKIAGMGADLLGEVIPVPGAGIALDAVAKALGTSKDKDEIAKALEQDPEAAAKLKKAQMEHEAELKRIKAEAQATHEQEVTKRQETVNDTIQIGYKQGVLWRRAVGWSFAIGVPVFVLLAFGLLAYGAYIGKLVPLVNALKGLVSAAQPIIYAYLAILGVAGYQEGKMGRTMAGEGEGGISKAVKAIRGRE